jgi:predicted PurR-regulated permease PerM
MLEQFPRNDPADRHLWQITAARDVIILILIALLLWFLYLLRGIFIPLLLALVLAHVFNPLITLLERKWGCPRPLTIAVLLAVVVLGCSALFAWLGPLLAAQMTDLVLRLPDYLRTLASTYGIDLTQLETAIRQYGIDFQQILGRILKTTGRALGFVSTVFSIATYLILSVALVLVYFFFFAWGFNRAEHELAKYLPESRRQRIVEIVSQMDQAIGSFFRGRLVIACIMGGLLSIGWFWAGVPYWFFLGMVTGLLNIIPYLSILTWPFAVLLKYLEAMNDTGSNPGFVAIAVWPTVVYVAVQLSEGWFLTPWIQSGQTNMSAATILIVVLIGGVLGGVWGLLFAIPLAACIKILLRELVLPRFRSWAAKH